MKNEFVIYAKLPSLNDYIDVCRTNKYKAAQFKKDIEGVIGWHIKIALAKGTLRPVKDAVLIECEWTESNKRRDVDNVQSSVKYILDCLVKYKVLPNDNPKYVKQIIHNVKYSKENSVEVKIIDLNENVNPRL